MKEPYMVQYKKHVITNVLTRIRKATSVSDQTVNLAKLKANICLEFGLRQEKVSEYINELVLAGKIRLDGEDVWATNEDGTIFKNEAAKRGS